MGKANITDKRGEKKKGPAIFVFGVCAFSSEATDRVVEFDNNVL